jgi:xanthine dehydrogenase accessory factor
MDSVDLEVLRSVVRWQSSGHRVVLATITRTWGSSPRPVGAMLALRDDGQVSGSVSGGCIEDDLIAQARAQTLIEARPRVVSYGMTAEEARRFGLPCGGTIEVVLESVGASSGIEALLDAAGSGQLIARELVLESGAVSLRPAAVGESLQFDGTRLVSVFGPRFRLLIIGAGQLSRFLARIALGLDFQVTVCDPREEYVDSWDVAGVRLLRTMPDDTVIAMRPDARSAVIALSHDPKLDDLALMEALRSEAFYVGAIGSRLNNARRRERLEEFDLDAAQIARLRGPIGLYIGSRTPPEIAISILAEIIASKNGVTLSDAVRAEFAKRDESQAGCVLP